MRTTNARGVKALTLSRRAWLPLLSALLAAAASQLGCSDSPAPPPGVAINPVTFTCHGAPCDSAAGKTARIGVLPGHEQPCDQVLRGTSEQTFASAFVISTISTDLEQRQDAISQQFSTGWVDESGQPTEEVATGDVTLCILVEGMGTAPTNAQLDSGEVFCQGDLGFNGDGEDHSGNGDEGVADCWVEP